MLHLLYVFNGYFYLHFMIILTIRFEDCMLKRLQAINLTKISKQFITAFSFGN